MPVSKDRSRGELEKLRGLSFKDKLWYIWNYYNYFIVGGIIAVAVIISLVRTCYFRPDTGIFIAWENPYIDDASIDVFKETLNERLFGGSTDETDRIVEISRFITISDDPQVIGQHYERLLAMVSAGMIDIFFLDAAALEYYSYIEYLQPLDDVLSEVKKLSPDAYEYLIDNAVYLNYGYEDATSSKQLMGIRVTDSPFFSELSVELYPEAYLCLSISSKNLLSVVHTLIALSG